MSIPEDPNRECSCEIKAVASINCIRCSECKGLLTPPSKLEAANVVIQEATAGRRDRNPEGSALVAAGKGGENFSAERRIAIKSAYGFAIGLLSGAIGGSTANPIGRRISVGLGLPELEEEAVRRSRAASLSDEDLEAVKQLLSTGTPDLQSEAARFAGGGRYAVAKLLDAVSWQRFGLAYPQAIQWLTELLEDAESDNVKSFLYLRRSKALSCFGERSQAASDIEQAVSLPQLTTENRIHVIRQGMQFGYTSISRDDVLNTDAWQELHRFMDLAFSHLGIATNNKDARDAFRLAESRYPSLAPGVSIFDAFVSAANAKDSPQDCEEFLEWHLTLIRKMQQYDPENGWNRYSPLAAQCLLLADSSVKTSALEFAKKTLDEARAYAQGELSGPAMRHAMAQKESRGTEWLLHRVLYAAYDLLKAENASSSAEATELRALAGDELDEPLRAIDADATGKTQVFAHAAKFYDRKTKPSDAYIDRDRFAEGNLPPWFSHWSYLPMPEGWDSLAIDDA